MNYSLYHYVVSILISPSLFVKSISSEIRTAKPTFFSFHLYDVCFSTLSLSASLHLCWLSMSPVDSRRLGPVVWSIVLFYIFWLVSLGHLCLESVLESYDLVLSWVCVCVCVCVLVSLFNVVSFYVSWELNEMWDRLHQTTMNGNFLQHSFYWSSLFLFNSEIPLWNCLISVIMLFLKPLSSPQCFSLLLHSFMMLLKFVLFGTFFLSSSHNSETQGYFWSLFGGVLALSSE